MSKVKRQPFGETPEPAARKLRVDGEKAEQKDERTIDKDHIRAISLMNLSPESVWNTHFPCCSGYLWIILRDSEQSTAPNTL